MRLLLHFRAFSIAFYVSVPPLVVSVVSVSLDLFAPVKPTGRLASLSPRLSPRLSLVLARQSLIRYTNPRSLCLTHTHPHSHSPSLVVVRTA